MTEQVDRPAGWDAVPHTDDLRGVPLETATQPPFAHVPAGPAGAAGPAGPGTLPYAYAPTPRATRRRMRRRTLVGLIAGGAAVLLLVVGGTVAYSAGSDAHSPTHPVEAFLDDLEHGHAKAALAAAGMRATKDDVLLTDAAYAEATNTVTDHRITGTETSGDSATVSALLRQGDHSVPATFQLTRTGSDGLFPVWRLDPVSLGSVQVAVQGPASTPVTIAGTTVATNRSGEASLSALPGRYPVAVDGRGWYTSTSGSAVVDGFAGNASTPVSLVTTLTDKGKQAAAVAVDAWVDACIATPSFRPDGCSFYAYGADSSSTYTNERWTLTTRPVVAVGDWSPRGWVVRTSSAGSASFRADFSGPTGSGVGEAGPIDVSADGYIAGFTATGATFVAAVTDSGSGDTGS